MKNLQYDVAVLGAGAAGLTSAANCAAAGLKTIAIDRDEAPGGVLLQCIHNGFGLHYFKEELTGPEYAARLVERSRRNGVDFLLSGMVMQIGPQTNQKRIVTVYSKRDGVVQIEVGAVILAMGCRERNRGNLGIPGDRCAGIFTAGLAQRLLNIDGIVPGKTAVIVGSGDIGLIMARRLSWCGIKVEAVVEIMPYPAGLSRNIAQCLEDFGIPLYLSTAVTGIHGHDRVSSITIAPLVEGRADRNRERSISCDTVLFSVGLLPENELSRSCNVALNPVTGGALVDDAHMSSQPGIFACGNVLHVHDLVDFVSEEAESCARSVVEYLRGGERPVASIGCSAGEGVRYVVPNRVTCGKTVRFYMRSQRVLDRARLIALGAAGQEIAVRDLRYVKPAEMIAWELEVPETAGDSIAFKLVEVTR